MSAQPIAGGGARSVLATLTQRLLPYCLLAPALAVFAGIFVIPITEAITSSFTCSEGRTFANYSEFLGSPYLGDLGFTLFIGLAAATMATFIAIPIALILRMPFRGRTVLYGLVLFPLVVPHIIAAYALWLSMARSGPVFGLLTSAGILEQAPMLSRNWIGLLIALVWKNFPITTLTITAAMESIDRSMEEAARDMRAGGLRRLVEIVLPLALPGIVAGFVLVFILSASGFSIPLIVYHNTRIAPLPLGIYYQALTEDNWAFASTLGVVLTTSTLVLLGLLVTAVRRIYREALSG